MANCEVMIDIINSLFCIYILTVQEILKICEPSSVIMSLFFNRFSSCFSLFCSKVFTLSSEIKLNLLWITPLSLCVVASIVPCKSKFWDIWKHSLIFKWLLILFYVLFHFKSFILSCNNNAWMCLLYTNLLELFRCHICYWYRSISANILPYRYRPILFENLYRYRYKRKEKKKE